MINSKFLIAAVLFFVAALASCTSKDAPAEKDFIGKWKTSRATTPIRLYESGEWELLDNFGGVRQYGVWQYFDNKVMWSYIVDSRFSHDTNLVLSVSQSEFRLREGDGNITVFTRLE